MKGTLAPDNTPNRPNVPSRERGYLDPRKGKVVVSFEDGPWLWFPDLPMAVDACDPEKNDRIFVGPHQ